MGRFTPSIRRSNSPSDSRPEIGVGINFTICHVAKSEIYPDPNFQLSGCRRDNRKMPRPSAADVVEPQPAPPPPLDLADASLYINRELGWLAFNQRVLDQANDPAHPLLERVKFLSIAASNLDEFYMVRVATLLKKLRAGMDDVSPDGLHTEQQLVAIRQRAAQMLDDIATCWQEQLRPQLEAEGIRLLEPQDYTPEAQAFLSGYFKSHIW